MSDLGIHYLEVDVDDGYSTTLCFNCAVKRVVCGKVVTPVIHEIESGYEYLHGCEDCKEKEND